MFGWLTRKTRRETLKRKMPRILHAYTALNATYPEKIMDTSWLPADKQTMIEIFKIAWLQANSSETRNWIETGWTLLGWFQDGVGDIPIDVRTPKDTPLDKYLEISTQKHEWLNVVLAECELRAREKEQFKTAHQLIR
jgi:hypothetical protein